jgi:probable F420-dependent oxidoreductase
VDISKPGVFLFLDSVDAQASVELARKAEKLGYSALWVVEAFGRDSLTYSAYLLARTERLVIGSGVASIWSREATNMAAAAKTAYELSEGRFILGLGVNNSQTAGIRGFKYGKPLASMRACLQTVRSAFDSAPAAPAGFGEMAKGYAAAKPPLVIAALNDKMVGVAASEADGTITYFVPPAHTAKVRKIFGPEPVIYAEQAVMLESDPSRARAAIRSYMSFYLQVAAYQRMLGGLGFTSQDWSGGGSDRLCDAIVAWGSADKLRERIEAHYKAGANHVCILPLDPAGGYAPDVRGIEALAPVR